MSYALSALILIRLDARCGQVVSVDDLAEHLQVTPGVVQAELELLEAARQLQTVRGADGVPAGAVVALPDAPPPTTGLAQAEWPHALPQVLTF
jgi:hypothetical protein